MRGIKTRNKGTHLFLFFLKCIEHLPGRRHFPGDRKIKDIPFSHRTDAQAGERTIKQSLTKYDKYD